MNRLFKKITNLMLSISNPPLFFYRVSHIKNKYVNEKTASRIREKNFKYYSRKDIPVLKFETFDKSGQIVHPHFLYDFSNYWLAFTPYPYGMEEYENPSIFYGKSIDDLEEFCNNPIAFQAVHRRGNHLSDPCLFKHNDDLFCSYRITNNNNGVIDNAIVCKKLLLDSRSTDDEIVLLKSNSEQLLSPAFFEGDGKLFMVCVNNDQYKSSVLSLYSIDCDFKVKDEGIIKCDNVPFDYFIWHIDIQNKVDSDYKSLFLLRKISDPGVFKLFFAHCKNFDRKEWAIDEEVRIDSKINRIMKHPYKSTFVPGNNSILLSFRDKKDRYSVMEVLIDEESK